LLAAVNENMKTLRVSHKTPDDTILVTIKVNGKERNVCTNLLHICDE